MTPHQLKDLVHINDNEDTRVTRSCGCVFCDIGLEPSLDGHHHDSNGRFEAVKCPMIEVKANNND